MKSIKLRMLLSIGLVYLILINPLAALSATTGPHRSFSKDVSPQNAILEKKINTAPKLGKSNNSGAETLSPATFGSEKNNGNASRIIKSSFIKMLERKPGETATLLPDGNWLLIGGEEKGGISSSAAIVDADTGKKQKLPVKLSAARAWHTATMLPDGRVMIFGGFGANGRVVEISEIFNPEEQTLNVFSSVGITPRAGHTATVLSSGDILIAGGKSATGETLGTIELWNSKTGKLTKTSASLRDARHRHSAALLPSGDVLVWNGFDSNEVALDDSEQYSLDTRQFVSTGIISPQEDLLPPYLVASMPRESDAGVAVDAHIALRFSKPLRAETVNNTNITLTNFQGVIPVKVVPAENAMLGFVTPLADLKAGTVYTLIINGATDSAGLAVPSTSISFTTIGDENNEGGHNHGDHQMGGQVNASKSDTHDHLLPQDYVPNKGNSDAEEWMPDLMNLKDWRSKRPYSEKNPPLPLQAAKGITALSGRVLNLDGKPLAEVTLQIQDLQVRTDATGRFLLTDVPVGKQLLIINGGTASTPAKQYAMFDMGVEITKEITTVMPFNIWLPVIDTHNITQLPEITTQQITAKTPRIPGLEVQMPAGARLRYPHGRALRNLTITPIPIDRTPFPLPTGATDGVLFTLQLHGAKVEGQDGKLLPGLRVVYPNAMALKAGTRVPMWNYNPKGQGWYIYGYGTVANDEKQVVPDAGTELQSMHCFTYLGGIKFAPDEGPPPGGGAEDGDPVDLRTGLFVYDKTDLIIPDLIPITLTRTYRNRDPRSRSFGVGTTNPYAMFLVGTAEPGGGGYQDLVLPDGGRIRYEYGYVGNQIPVHTATPTIFYGSTLSIINGKWEIKLLDGTIFRFLRIRGVDDGDYDTGITDLIAIIDRYGNELRIEDNRITSPSGRWIELTINSSSERFYSISQVKDNVGRIVKYTYDSNGRLWQVTNPNNGVTEYSYDGFGQLLTIKDPRGIIYLTNEYDNNGRVFRQTQGDNSTYQFSYTLDANGEVTQTDVTNERGFVRRVTFNSSGYMLTDTAALGQPEEQTVTFERNEDNLPLSVTDALGRRTDYAYDDQGNVTSVTNLAETSEAVTSSLTYEPTFNNVASVTDPLSHTTTFGYDPKGNRTSITDPLNHQTTFAYNEKGQLVSTTDPLNHTVQLGYDGGDLTTVTDELNRSVTRSFDAAGRPTQARNSLGNTVSSKFNSLNQVTKVTNPLGRQTSFGYDVNGNLLSLTDPRGAITNYTYDVMDRVKIRKDALQGAASTTTTDYDLAGNVTKTTDRRGKITTLKYDALNRNTFVGFGTTGPEATPSYESTITSTFDKANRLTQVVDSASGTISYEYDNFDRLKKETTPRGVVSYSYDQAGRQKTMTVTGQAVVNYNYDAANRLTSIVKGAETVSFGYDNANRPTSLSLPNGVTVSYEYDDASQLTAIIYKKGAATLGDLTYGYDQVGRRVSVGGTYAKTDLPATFNQQLTYNAANRLTQRGTTALTYDANGNLTNDGTTTYTWNARNQLVGMSRTGLTASFAYDVFGRRVSKTINGATTRFLYDGADAVQEQNASGVPTANMLVGGVDTVFSRTDANGTRTLLHDGLGSAIGLLDSAGATTTSYSYEPFGATTQTGAASTNASKYTGREDDGTGLYYYRARYYSPTLQRFISEDPIGFAGGDVNLYAYVGNDPINFLDPSGLAQDPNVILDQLQIGLGVGGLIPGLGEIFDGLDTAISAARGDCVGVGLGATSMIPGLGMGAGITKIGRKFNKLADNAFVVRGGQNLPDSFLKGSGVTVDNAGLLNGVSVNSAPGLSIKELSTNIPHNQLGVTTVGDIRALGGDVVPSRTTGNPHHCTMCGITAEQASGLFTPTIRNPNK